MKYKLGDKVLIRHATYNIKNELIEEKWLPGVVSDYLGFDEGKKQHRWQILLLQRWGESSPRERVESAMKPDNSDLIKKWMGV